MPTQRGQYNRSGVEAARRSILESHNQFWRTADIDTAPSTAQRLLADLVKRGELRHIRRGLYWRGTKTPLGMAPPAPQALAIELAGGPGAGPAGLSAANALRLSTQIPRRADYALVGRPPTSAPTVRFVDRSTRRGRAEHALAPTEVAALEVLDGWDRLIETGPEEAMDRLSELIKSGSIDAPRIASAGATEPGPSRARLRHLMHRAGRPDLADAVPAADPRTAAQALFGLASG
ncbi:hypothetical protein [Mycolicibacterium sphagni]|uniref:AbiEi antitoxin C-terminal domain-containing protein n=1 Tax=Mycolicibacterium sphagni TaxID=1786 RepID=A0A255DAE8_9MYCO|nr:hypothetical protein [Mycolicibacterium sphagni]OYN76080.1 hypothetical protein CG716_23250 [Mycolicibacterium sphagni]